MSFKVDFFKDSFDRIWLISTDKLIMRQARKVPSKGGNVIAQYVV